MATFPIRAWERPRALPPWSNPRRRIVWRQVKKALGTPRTHAAMGLGIVHTATRVRRVARSSAMLACWAMIDSRFWTQHPPRQSANARLKSEPRRVGDKRSTSPSPLKAWRSGTIEASRHHAYRPRRSRVASEKSCDRACSMNSEAMANDKMTKCSEHHLHIKKLQRSILSLDSFMCQCSREINISLLQ